MWVLYLGIQFLVQVLELWNLHDTTPRLSHPGELQESLRASC